MEDISSLYFSKLTYFFSFKYKDKMKVLSMEYQV